MVLHPDELHDGRAGAETGFRYRMLYIEPRLVREALGERAGSLPFVRAAVSADPRLMATLRPALDDVDRGMEALETDQAILGIADALLSLDPSTPGRPSSGVCAVPVARARQFLHAHFHPVPTPRGPPARP